MFSGQRWARWAGIAVALLALVWAVGWAEIQPKQSLIGAFIHASVIFAVATHPVDVESADDAAG